MGWGRVGTTHWHKETLGVMDTFIILIVVMISWVYRDGKMYSLFYVSYISVKLFNKYWVEKPEQTFWLTQYF